MRRVSRRRSRRVKVVSFSALLALATGVAAAAEAPDPDEPNSLPTLETHGFVSQGAIKSTANNYLAAHSHRGTFEFAEVGINFTTQPTDKLRLGLQLFTSKLGATGTFSVKADWFYLDYRWRDWLGLRAGRVKLPLGLYNDTIDIDAARVPILLPQSVYPIADRDYLLAQTGAEIYGFLNLRAAGALEYRLYGGTIYIPVTNTPGAPVQITALDTKYVVGGRLLWDTPLPGLRAGVSLQRLEINFQLLATLMAGTPATPASADIPVTIGIGSLEYAAHDVLVAAEYSRWYARLKDTTNPALFPVTATTSERLYLMSSYRVNRYFVPGLYYSLLRPDLYNDPTMISNHGVAASQHDVAASLRFDLNAHWLVKLEGHFMHGTAGLDPALNGGTPIASLEGNWYLFLIKTTAYF